MIAVIPTLLLPHLVPNHQSQPDNKPLVRYIQSEVSRPTKKLPVFPDRSAEAAKAKADKQKADLKAAKDAEDKRQAELALQAQRVADTPQSAPKAVYGDIQSIIVHWAEVEGANPQQLLRVAACESGFNIYAHNPSGATGLFQFMPSTFYGNGGSDLYDPNDQARVAARMFVKGQSGQWVCK